MPDLLNDHDQMQAALRLIECEAEAYLATIDEALVRPLGDVRQRARAPGG
ncbi:MAG: hypothetical protein ABI334_00435 [Candidatus Dormiibacterota bacterium]